MMMFEWLLIIPLVLWLFRNADARGDRPNDGGSAKRILEERLARGEIDVDEYNARRQLL